MGFKSRFGFRLLPPEFQEVVLLSILVLDKNAYGISIQEEIKDRLNRKVSRGGLHAALIRLEEKGFVRSNWGESSPERGGRRKKFYTVTQKGKAALVEIRDIRNAYWKAIPSLKISHL